MKKTLLSSLLLIAGLTLNAQTTGDYRTVASGNWGIGGSNPLATQVWETFDGENWVTATLPPTSSSSLVTIKSGHTITLNATSSAKDLVVEAGATLKSGQDANGTSAVRNIRLAGTLTNNGTVGGSANNDRVSVEGYLANGTMTITGPGAYYLNLIRCNGIVQNANLVIDADVNMNSYISGYYTTTSGSNSVNQDDDVVNIIINAGKTVVGGTGSYLHYNTTPISTDNFGTYTYTINGTLDFSASTATTAIVEHSTKEGKNVTVNINGTWKLGAAGFRGISNPSTATPSNTVFNIGSSGLVDASLVNNFVFKNATTGEVAFFNITGDGILKQNPAAGSGSNTTTAFIGSNNIYSPVVFTGATAGGVYTLNVQNGPDNGKQVVKKQWKVLAPEGTTGVSLAFGWQPLDQAANFDPQASIVYNYSSNTWNAISATNTASGSGTPISPYSVSTGAISSFGVFMIGNESPVGTPLPLDLLSFTARAINNAIKLYWTTANEEGVRNFAVERKLSSGQFETIATVAARNQKSIQEYSFADYSPQVGENYYRLKSVDFDGKITHSDVIKASLNSAITNSVYPNPSTGTHVSFTHSARSSEFQIFNSTGTVLIKGDTRNGETVTPVNVSNLLPGTYYAQFGPNPPIRFVKL